MTQLQTIYEGGGIPLAGLPFLFVALPLLLLLYYAVPKRFRPGVLLSASLAAYTLLETETALVAMAASVALGYGAMRLMEHFDEQPVPRRLCFVLAVLGNIGLILWFGVAAQMRAAPLTLGVQIYTLCAVECLLAVYRREITYERSIVRFALYCCFFPRLYAGPLQPYGEFARQVYGVRLQPGAVLTGAGQFLQGVFKLSIFGGSLYGLGSQASALNSEAALAAWLLVFCHAFALYYMLSGFSDIAQGLGAMFGLTLPKNFYYPYQSRSVEDFFDRFNITVSRFLRDTVYTGLQGSTGGPAADALNLLVTGMLMGLWFGLRLNYLLWGVYLAVFIILERYAYPRLLAGVPTLFARLGTLCVVLAGFTVFVGSTPLQSAQLIGHMFRFGNFVDDQVLYLLSSNWLLLLLSCFFATNLVNLVVVKLRRAAPAVAGVLFGALDLAILVCYVALSL